MKPLILHPTPTAQWQALVEEAETALSMNLSEELESYLVFLLMRFSKNPQILQSILATDFLLSLEQLRRERDQTLRDVGDKCLLFAGFFPGRARRCRVRISYFVKLGQMAYGSLSEMYPSLHAQLFERLRFHFVGLMDILQTIHELKNDKLFLDLFQAEELWSDTHSKHALKVLQQKTDGFTLGNLGNLGNSPSSPIKH